MKLPGEIFDGRDDSRGGPVYGIANHREAAIGDGLHDVPSGKRGERIDGGGRGVGMSSRENQEVGLQANDFFQTDMGPVLFGIHDGDSTGQSEGISDESVFADGDERLVPDDEKNTLWSRRGQPLLEFRKMMFHFSGDSCACFGSAQHISELLRRTSDFIYRMWVSGVRRDAQVIQAVDRLQAVQAFCYDDKIRMKNGNLFQARIDRVADFSFFLRIRRKIAVGGVSNQMILQPKRVNGFSQTWSERDDAVDRLGNANGAAGFVGDFAVDRG